MTAMLDAKQIAAIVREQDHDEEVRPSTLHYYVQAGIVPPAVGRGRSAYAPEHLARFRLARRLKREGLSLAEIREEVNRRFARAHLAAAELKDAPATPRSDTPRTLRFKGGFSLQVPAGTSDEQVARLYAAVAAAIGKETKSRGGK